MRQLHQIPSRRACALAALLACQFAVNPALAQSQSQSQSHSENGLDDALVTDRPDFVESSAVVGKGRVQVETSLAFERKHQDGVRERATSMPTLLRLGVSDSIELRVETDGWTHQWSRGLDTSDASGMADTALGVKWHVRDGKDGAPALGLLLHADLPSGAARIGTAGVRPSLRGVAEWELPGELSLGVMPGIARERNDDGGRFTSGIFGVTLGKQWAPRWRSFVEVSAPRIAHARDGGTLLNADVGGAYLVNKDCQIDAAISRGLNRNTPDLSVTVGLSFRL